jgi:hypothetical protein
MDIYYIFFLAKQHKNTQIPVRMINTIKIFPKTTISLRK